MERARESPIETASNLRAMAFNLLALVAMASNLIERERERARTGGHDGAGLPETSRGIWPGA